MKKTRHLNSITWNVYVLRKSVFSIDSNYGGMGDEDESDVLMTSANNLPFLRRRASTRGLQTPASGPGVLGANFANVIISRFISILQSE